MRTRCFAILAAIAATLALSATASARAGDHSLTQTYPVATALCVKAHAGTLPAALAPKVTAVIAACDALENPFPGLVSTVDAAEATLLNTLSAQRGLVAAACPKPVSDRAACMSARATAKSTDAAARSTEQAAVSAFRTAIDANRTTFWSAISALR
jgi:hypothetical protein